MIGVNDQFRGYDIRSFEVEFRSLLDRGPSFADGRLKQSRRTIPDWGVSPFGKQFEAGSIAADIERFNFVLVKETAN